MALTPLLLLTLLVPQQQPLPAARNQPIVVTLEAPDAQVTGRLIGMDSASLSLLVKKELGGRLDVPVERIRMIATHERDSILDGAIAVGVVTGAVMGLWCTAICREAPSPSRMERQAALRGFIAGALIGGVIDYALTRRPIVLWKRR